MNVLFEDNHIIVAVKPQNVPSQADSSGDGDFLSQVKEYVRVKYEKPGEAYIGLVHRLDRPAGGLMVFARTSKASRRLAQQMQSGLFEKVYAAVVTGDPPAHATLENYLCKDSEKNTVYVVGAGQPGAKAAVLSYDAVAKEEGYTLLRIDLGTGRSHQIRVQLSHIGAPIVGDRKYGGAPGAYLCLWAKELAFEHPVKKQRMHFDIPLPDYYPFSLFV